MEFEVTHTPLILVKPDKQMHCEFTNTEFAGQVVELLLPLLLPLI